MSKKLSFLFNSLLVISALLTFSSFNGCSTEGNETQTGPARLVVTLVDSPADFAAVNIDIQEISLKTSSSENSGWVNLEDFTPGVYNILEYTGGQSLNLGDISVEPGTISQIRLKLGNNSTLKLGGYDDGSIYESKLAVPSGSESGLKINVDYQVDAGQTYYFVLDFDAAKSVVKLGNTGQYILKPVIRMIADGSTGAISGEIFPAQDNILISVISGNSIVASSYAPEDLSKFFVAGIDQGTYKVSFESSSQNFQKIIEDIVVENGKITDMGSITMD